MSPLNDLAPEAIRQLPDDELRVRVAMLQGWEYDAKGVHPSFVPVLWPPPTPKEKRRSAPPAERTGGPGWWFSAIGATRVPNYPASYDAVMPVVRGWAGEDHERWDALWWALDNRCNNPFDNQCGQHGMVYALSASPRDLCVALLCAAREVGA